MKVFKFGGASVNSAEAVRNMAQIVQHHLEAEPLIVVVSAMGKTTNLLEKLVPGIIPDEEERRTLRQQLEDYHREIASALLPDNKDVQDDISAILSRFDEVTHHLLISNADYNYSYDQTVSFGEIISTSIIANYLNHLGINTLWEDARKIIITDDHYREGHVDWMFTEGTCRLMCEAAKGYDIIITQGFIGGVKETNATTTLGREGSDYSAAILAYCLNAESVTIWKDVPGFLNADPKYYNDTVKISQIPYNEAIELAYYGASVIHPKTVKPIQNKGIPLYIRSFLSPESEGSVVGNYHTISPVTPLYIFRNNQMLLSIFPRDYSFIAEDNLQVIFGLLNELGIRVNLMQNTALSFSICIDNTPQLTDRLVERLKSMFRVRYNENLQLITIRYYTQEVIDSIVAGRPVLLEQRSRSTEQMVVPCR